MLGARWCARFSKSESALSSSIRLLDLARTGRNPKTGEPFEVPSRRVPVFKPSTPLRERVDLG
ncbi:MAG: HU family DNA-binding protein [Gemmatimonadales bacterium]|nr:HU family DNA-binding protein [Candidatus Palauibacter denitrificans]